MTRLTAILLVLSPLALGTSACASIAVAVAPEKEATEQTPSAKRAEAEFWEIFHGGRYDEIDRALEEHLRVVIETPSDPVTVSHVGWLHAWKIAENARSASPAASVTAHATLARRYFEEALTLRPEEPRYLGFLASFTMAEASILDNQKQLRRGYFMMKDAVDAWPEFNLFTSGYTLSANPADSSTFREGLEQQWETLDRCLGERISRDAPKLDQLLALETTQGRKRVCFNSWIAPHNWEGFFLNFGDMLARAKDSRNARAMYEGAKLSRTYGAWPYQGVLERRLARLDRLGAILEPAKRRGVGEDITMGGSAFACMGCHQASGAPAVDAATPRVTPTVPLHSEVEKPRDPHL